MQESQSTIQAVLDDTHFSKKRMQEFETVLKAVFAGTSAVTGDYFFQSLVEHLATAMGYQYALVGEVIGSEKNIIKTMAVWANGQQADNFTYDLKGTPCDNVVNNQGACYYGSEVTKQFPEDLILVDMGVESYMGVPVFNLQEDLLGILVVLDVNPILESSVARPILTLFAARAGAEMTRLNSEKQLRHSLHEKETLLQELHHRVKNNLQIISSLVNIQSRKVKDSSFKSMLKETNARIRSIALIHERLYQSHDLTKLSFDEYIMSLIQEIKRVLREDSQNVKVVTHLEHHDMSVETAVPCGLILTELLSNALKYAFPDKEKGLVTIRFSKLSDENFELTISDDGVGMPDGVNPQKTESTGLNLVYNLVKSQLHGTIKEECNHGASFTICFKELSYKNRMLSENS